MRLIYFVSSVLVGVLLGLGVTYAVIAHGLSFDQQVKGGWTFIPRAGAPEMDPYRRARLFIEGELPLASGEGYVLRATRDADGLPLRGECQYRLSGPLPRARFWTLTLTTADGTLIEHPTERAGFTSSEIIRPQDGHGVIEIGPEPLAGNWLPSPPDREITMLFRFYETPLSATATLLDAAQLPRLTRIGCRP